MRKVVLIIILLSPFILGQTIVKPTAKSIRLKEIQDRKEYLTLAINFARTLERASVLELNNLDAEEKKLLQEKE